MKKIKFLGAAILAASLIFAGCANGSDDDVDSTPDTEKVVDEKGGEGSEENGGSESGSGEEAGGEENSGEGQGSGDSGSSSGGESSGSGDSEDAGDDDSGDEDEDTNEYTAPDLTGYFKKYLISATETVTPLTIETWDGVSTDTINDDGTWNIIPGTKWGSSTACISFQGIDAGRLSLYDYIVFTLDATNFTFKYDEEDADNRNEGVNIKIPEVMRELASNCVVDGNLRTYYAPISSFGTAPLTAEQFGVIIGGTGTLKVCEAYIAAETDPSTIPVTGITVTANTSIVQCGQTATIKVIDSNYLNITDVVTYEIAANDTTGSSVDNNVFTAGTTEGVAKVTVSYEGFTEDILFTVSNSKDYGKYFKTTSGPAEDALNETGYMDLWFQNWDPVVNISSATASETEYSIVRESVGAQFWSTQFFYKEEAGRTYDIALTVTSTTAGDITINDQVVSLEANTPYEYTQSNASLNDKGTIVSIQLGKADGNEILPAGTFTISDFSVTPASAAE